MNIIYFTHNEITDHVLIPSFLENFGDRVFIHTDRIDLKVIEKYNADFIVSDRARYLIRDDVLNVLDKKIVNLHPSFLPYNRGYNPQFWSVVEGTPSGNTIHYIDENIDTGDIIAQQKIDLLENDTLRTFYNRHRNGMVDLFMKNWELIKTGKNPRISQPKKGTFHYKKDLDAYYFKLPLGWDTSVSVVKQLFAKEPAWIDENSRV